MKMKLSRALVCEFLGTAFLLAAVVGSGAMAHRFDMGNVALSVLCVAFATAGTLSACIFAFGSISAHFNPVLSLALAVRGEFSWRNLVPYWIAQITGAVCGVVITNLMFDVPAFGISDTIRSGSGQWLGEFVATFGLLGIIFGSARFKPAVLPISVPFYVAGAVFFTSSTCFANPAVTIGRLFTKTLCGIDPGCVMPFIAFQLVGCLAALVVFGWLYKDEDQISELTCQSSASKVEPVQLAAECQADSEHRADRSACLSR